MSKVKIQGNASGTGIFTVAAPATNTDRTITLPDVDATVLTTAGGTFNGTNWSNTTGGDVKVANSNAVGSALTLLPTASSTFSAGWSLYAGAAGAAIGDGSIGLWNHTAQGYRFSIDQTGRMRLPYQPSFFAYHNAGDVDYGPNTVLPYQNTRHNVGNHYNTSTGTFTAPIAGTYMFSATCNGNWSGSYSGIPRAYWQVNGSNIGNSVHFRGPDATDQGLEQRSSTVILQLAASDTVRIQVQLNQFDLFGANHFCGHMLG